MKTQGCPIKNKKTLMSKVSKQGSNLGPGVSVKLGTARGRPDKYRGVDFDRSATFGSAPSYLTLGLVVDVWDPEPREKKRTAQARESETN